MSWQKSCLSLTLTVKLLAIAVGLPAQAEPAPANSQAGVREDVYQVAQYRPPANLGKPPTTGGGTRGDNCANLSEINSTQPLTALMPRLSPEGDMGLTVSAHPDFFVYVPSTSARQGEFVLRDEQWNDVYRTTINISGESEIVKVSIPESNQGLEIGQNYRWHFALVCPENNRGIVNEVAIEGWTQRTELNAAIAAELETATESDRPQIYAQNGIWHEAVSTLAELMQQSPNNATLTQQWNELLESAGLAELESESSRLTASEAMI
jgi:hypothetical protein